MEGHDTFTQGIEIGDEDPFAGSDFGDWEQPGNDSPAEAPAEEPPAPPSVAEDAPPVPAAQPEPSAAPTAPTPPEPAAAQAPSPDGEQAAGDASGTPQAQTAPPATPSSAETPPESAPAPAPAPPSAPAGVAAPPEAQMGAQSVPQEHPLPQEEGPWTAADMVAEERRREQEGDVPADAEGGFRTGVPEADVPIDTEGLPEADWHPDMTEEEARDATRVLTQDDLDEAGYDGPVAEADEVPVTHPAHPVNQETEVQPDDAPPPEETTDKRGRVVQRRYYLFVAADYTDMYKRLSWYEDDDHKIVAQNTKGAKRQTIVLAKTPEDALKVGFVAAGSPQNGVELVPVAVQNFQPRKVAPIPPEPMKQRLSIS